MKKTLALILTLVMLLGSCVLPLSVSAVADDQSTSDNEFVRSTSSRTLADYEGSGTEEDPYLISTAEDFAWLGYVSSSTTNLQTFEGVYFVQTNDIDFEGNAIWGIGGTCYTRSEKAENPMNAFRGNYDGNGYSLKNARITWGDNAYDPANNNVDKYLARWHNWGCGVFGNIYGATIRNIVLDNIYVQSIATDSGFIVGKAAAPIDKDIADYNLVENCVVKSNCRITSYASVESARAQGIFGEGDRQTTVGGIVGISLACTIRNCINEGDLYNAYDGTAEDKIDTAVSATVDAAPRAMGGIVGMIAGNTVIENCVNKGDINLVMANEYTLANSYHMNGGIVGNVSSTGSDTLLGADESATIKNCYNSGTLTITGNSETLKNSYAWGGILGTSYNLKATVNIENCYNLNPKSELPTVAGAQAANPKKGIVGYALNLDSLTDEQGGKAVNIVDCYSVEVDNTIGMSGNYRNSNLVYHKTVSNTNGTWHSARIYFTNPSGVKEEVIMTGADAVSTTVAGEKLAPKTEAEVMVETDILDYAIAKAQVEGRGSIFVLGTQADETAGSYMGRVIGGLASIDGIEKVGFAVDGIADPETTKNVYTKFKGKKENEQTQELEAHIFTAEELDTGCFAMYYFNAVKTVNNETVPASGTVRGRFFVVNKLGITVYGDYVTMEFTDGVLTNATRK